MNMKFWKKQKHNSRKQLSACLVAGDEEQLDHKRAQGIWRVD